MPCNLKTNQSKKFNQYYFDMQYVIIAFDKTFSDAPTSGLKSELRIRSWLHAFVTIFDAFLKSLNVERFDKI